MTADRKINVNAETAGLLARETANKVKAELPHAGIEYARVIGVSYGEGLVPLVNVHLAGDPPESTRTVPCLTGVAPVVGQTVALIWDPPAGCYIFGTPEITLVPTGRMSLACLDNAT